MTRRAAVGVAVLLLLSACDSDRRAISREDLPSVPQEPAIVVELDGEGFERTQIEVSTTDLVEFVNTGDDDHGVRTADSSIHTGLLLPGESTFVVFDEPGRYELVDVAEDSHTMTVVATEPRPSG